MSEREKRAKIVIESFDGIIPYCEVFYLRSILYSAGRCLETFEHYDYLKSQKVNPDYFASIVQEAVGHAAALSRYFWPSSQGKKNEVNQNKLKELRGKKLCKVFGLTKKSPLYNRDLRNAWEHFDERLDVYLLENEAGCFFPDCIVGDDVLRKDPVRRFFKLLDTKKECFVLMDKKYYFSKIRSEIQKVFEKASELDRNGGRLFDKG